MPTVHFHPMGKTRKVKAGTTILAAANQVEVPLGQSCSGDGTCGWCRVTILSGAENLGSPSPLERKLRESRQYSPDERVACLATVHGDILVTTTYW